MDTTSALVWAWILINTTASAFVTASPGDLIPHPQPPLYLNVPFLYEDCNCLQPPALL